MKFRNKLRLLNSDIKSELLNRPETEKTTKEITKVNYLVPVQNKTNMI